MMVYSYLDMCLVLLIVSTFTATNATIPCPNCELKGCHQVRPDKLNVHLIPHTHDDAGWLKTVDQYYYGGNHRHAPFGVQYIIDSVLAELEANETRRFTYVESAFLWRWWHDRSEYHREKMRRLVKEGRLQITHGGWVMSDEAVTHYTALIHQMSFGLKFIKEIFGECNLPNVAWQIDSFGHSSEVALQFAEMGYDAVFFGRIDRDDYKKRLNEQSLEMVWRPDPELGPKGDLFAGVLYNLYMPPDGFCFDVFCNDEPIMDNPNLHGNNVEPRVSSFVYYAKLWANAYRTNHVMVTMGGDFNYMVAGSWFVNMDKLIKYGNEYHNDINILYSTPSCYVQSLQTSNITWPVKDTDDFFPYSSYEGKYWTGYYTSRPTFKYLAHKVNQLLMVSSSLVTFLKLEHAESGLFFLERVVALIQHHDAITGTEKQHVADDYTVYLQEAITTAEHIFTKAFRKFFGEHYRHQHFCMKTNISECKLSEERSTFMVNLYNPLGHEVDTAVRLPLPFGQYTVLGQQGTIDNELIPLPRQLIHLAGRKSSAKHDLFFFAKDLAPLGITTFYVKRERLINTTMLPASELLEENGFNDTFDGMHTVDNFGFCQLVFNSSTGLLTSIILDNETLDFEQNFFYYAGNRKYDHKASGAYTFGTSNMHAKVVASKVSLRLYAGYEVIEIHQTFNEWISQVIRLKKGDCSVEFTWLVGPIDISGRESKEIITRYKTGIKSNNTFWTDSNGRRFVQRRRNWRSSWKFSGEDTIASNYYPVTSAARIGDESTCLTVLTDRAQGASSLQDGELEFMLHRRLTSDDAKGVLEALNEISHNQGLIARGTHTVQFIKNSHGCFGAAAVGHRKTALIISSGPWISLNTAETAADIETVVLSRKVKSMLNTPLPENVHMLSLQRRTNNTILLRLEHIFDKHEHPTLSDPVTLNLTDLFKHVFIHQVDELTLDGNRHKHCTKDVTWNHDGVLFSEPNNQRSVRNVFSIILQPMEIKTFLLTISEY